MADPADEWAAFDPESAEAELCRRSRERLTEDAGRTRIAFAADGSRRSSAHALAHDLVAGGVRPHPA